MYWSGDTAANKNKTKHSLSLGDCSLVLGYRTLIEECIKLGPIRKTETKPGLSAEEIECRELITQHGNAEKSNRG